MKAVLDSRLAQLSPPARDLAGVAAAIGREFTTNVLAAAARASDEVLVQGLDELWRRRIVREQGTDAYDFSHDKIREAAYAALGPARARGHHQRIAQALEHRHADELDEVAGRIAAHYDRAGAARAAAVWYERAAEAARRLYADRDAVRSLERGLELARGLPSDVERMALELRLLTVLPAPLVAAEGLSQRVGEIHDRGLELAAALGVEPEAPLLRSLAFVSLARGEFETARDFGEQLRARGERERDDVLRVEGGYVLGIAAYWQGHLVAARAHFEEAIEHCRPEQRSAHLLRYAHDPEVICLTRLAHTLWLLGDEKAAERARAAGLALADELDHPYTRAVATIWAAVLALDQRDDEGLRAYLQMLMTTRPEDGPVQHRIVAAAFAGVAELLDGRTEEGLERVRSAVVAARSREPAAPGFHGVLTHILLEAYARADAVQEGLVAADEMLAMRAGEQLWEAETRRLRAEFLAALGAETAQVEAELERAVAVAERQGAAVLARRASESLIRLRAGTL